MDKLRLPDNLLGFLAQSRAEAVSVHAWAGAFRERRFSEAVIALELQLQEHPDSVEPRLWWVLVQLELNQVPLSALTTPLIELLPRLREDGSHHRLSIHVFLSLASRLAEKNQLRLGLTLVEHALEFAEFPGVLTPVHQRELHEYSLAFLEEELARTNGRRENKDYIAKLEKRLAERRAKKIPDARTQPAKKALKSKQPALSSKTLFEGALKGETSASSHDSIDDRPIHTSAILDAAPREGRRKAPLWAVVICGLCFVVFGIYRGASFLFTSSTLAEPGMLLAMGTIVEVPAQPVLPDLLLSRRDLIDIKFHTINSNLAQIGERVKGMGTRPASLDELSNDPSVDHAALHSDAGKALEKPKDDELVSIEGPADEVKPAPVDPRRTPRLEPGKVNDVKVEDLGRNPPKSPESPLDLKVGSDGRVYGPTRDQDPAVEARLPDGRAGQTLEGTPLRSYEVQDLEKPQFYKTIAATNVLASPSLLSSAVSRLDANTTVQVVSRMGQWLELRSAQGKRGYIFAQDAVPAQ